MRSLPIDELTATEAVAEKLGAKHGVHIREVEEVVFGRRTVIRRGRDGLYLLYGRTDTGRMLFCVIALQARKARIVTARSMTAAERRSYVKQAHS